MGGLIGVQTAGQRRRLFPSSRPRTAPNSSPEPKPFASAWPADQYTYRDVIPIGTTMTWRFINNVSALPATGVSGTTPAVTLSTRADTTPDH
ncbi:hypothetical protein SHIRM173S_06322 [Streptomyces hirsutus]